MDRPRDVDYLLSDLQKLVEMDATFVETAERAVDIGAAHLGVGHGHFIRIVPELDHWEVVASTDDADGPVPVGEVFDLRTTFCRHTVDRDDTLALSDVSGQGFADDIAYERHGWNCYATTPVKIRDRLYGTLCFADETTSSELFDTEDVTLVECLADVLERHLERNERELTLENRNALLEIFCRVLRHNLRNDLSVVRGYVELLVDQLDDPATDPEVIRSKIEKLESLGEKSGELKRIAEADSGFQEYSVPAVVEEVGSAVERDYPRATVRIDAPADARLTALPTVKTALYELIENAIEHGNVEAACRVTVESRHDEVAITVADDGPGLPEMERRVLQGDPETQVDHGQGLGLWILRWVVDGHGGAIETTVSEGGTEITISVPRPNANDRLIGAPGTVDCR